jgi:lysozyme
MIRTPNVIDIYHGDNNDHGSIDFTTLAMHGVWGVVHKATQGTRYVDKLFGERISAALAAGMCVGAYHFLDSSNATEQAAAFVETVNSLKLTPHDGFLLAADFEKPPSGNHASLQQLYEFMSYVDKHSPPGTLSVCYSSDLIRETLKPTTAGHVADDMRGVMDFFRQHGLWLAEYGPHENTPWPWKLADQPEIKPFLWQFSETGHLPAILGKVDCNFFDGTKEQLQGSWATGGAMIKLAPLNMANLQGNRGQMPGGTT